MPNKIWRQRYEVGLLKGIFGTRGFYQFREPGGEWEAILSPKEGCEFLKINKGDILELTLRKVKKSTRKD